MSANETQKSPAVAPDQANDQAPPPPPTDGAQEQNQAAANRTSDIKLNPSSEGENNNQVEAEGGEGEQFAQTQVAANQAAPAEATPAEAREEPAQLSGENRAEHLEVGLATGDSRRVSVVSFKEVCELYEIDLEKGERDRELIKSRPAALHSVRYYIMLLALISPFVTTYSRTIINFAITDMIDPRFVHKQAESQLSEAELTPNATRLLAFDIDHSCPVDEELRSRLIEEESKDTRRAQTTSGEKFEWDAFSQGLLKGAYAYGHAFFQIPGSRLSELYGSHQVISLGAGLIGACCLAAPLLASLHFYLLFADLVLLGILGSFMTPAAMTLFGNWLTPGEKSLMVSFLLVGSRLGYALSSFLCGQLLQAGISWRYVFYSSGWIGLLFGGSFLLLARSRPRDHPLVSRLELDYLATKNRLVRESLVGESGSAAQPARRLEMRPVANGHTGADPDASAKTGPEPEPEPEPEQRKHTEAATKRRAGAPWLALATSAPVWTFVVTKFCVKMAGDLAHIELPSYLKRVMHYSAADNGKVNAWNYVIFCVGCLAVGALAKLTTKRRPFGWSKTTIRKLFQSISSFGVSIILMLIALSVCDRAATEILLLSFFFVTTFGIGGEAQAPYDLSERYSGTIHAIGSSLAISGAIEPTLVGYFLRGRSADKDQWRFVWLGASAISFLGGLVFLLFGEAEVQPFDEICATARPAAESAGARSPEETARVVAQQSEAAARDDENQEQEQEQEQDNASGPIEVEGAPGEGSKQPAEVGLASDQAGDKA